jgi:small subunit ribosomal protein S17
MNEQKRVLIGRVLSNRMDKAHDAENTCQIGDLVKIIESRPLSREKRWLVTDILETV